MGPMHRRRILVLALAVAFAAAPASAGRARAVEPVPLPLAGIIIALDPGHNGGNASHGAAARKKVFVGNGWKACNTTGTSTRSGYPEHRFTFSVANWAKARLEALGATAISGTPASMRPYGVFHDRTLTPALSIKFPALDPRALI